MDLDAELVGAHPHYLPVSLPHHPRMHAAPDSTLMTRLNCVHAQPVTPGGIGSFVTVRAQVSDLGKGSFGVTKLMRHLPTGELVAVKLIERGSKVISPGVNEL